MIRDSKILILDSNKFLGRVIEQILKAADFSQVVLVEDNLTVSDHMKHCISSLNPEFIFVLGGVSGGIQFNTDSPAEIMSENLAVQMNIFEAARRGNLKKILFLGASCMYPKDASQPIKEGSIFTGPLEETSEAYATAKLAGFVLGRSCKRQFGTDFVCVVPATIYGPSGHFDTVNSHVMGSLIRKFHEAKVSNKDVVEVWGSGRARREFIYVDDLARACVFLMIRSISYDIVNVGNGFDVSVFELAHLIAKTVGFRGKLTFDQSKPEGVLRKLLDSSRVLQLGFGPVVDFEDSLKMTYDYFLKNYNLTK